MRNRSEILNSLRQSKLKHSAIQLKICHQSEPFVAHIEEIIEEREIVKLNPNHKEGQPLVRNSYYIDEIESVKKLGISSVLMEFFQ